MKLIEAVIAAALTVLVLAAVVSLISYCFGTLSELDRLRHSLYEYRQQRIERAEASVPQEEGVIP